MAGSLSPIKEIEVGGGITLLGKAYAKRLHKSFQTITILEGICFKWI